MRILKEYFDNHKVIPMILVLSLCFSAGFFGAYYFNSSNIANAEINKNTESLTVDQKIVKVNGTTKFVYIRKYTKSQTVNIEEKVPPDTLIGADEKTVSIAISNWKLESFTSEKVTFSKQIDSYSPGCYVVGATIQNEEEMLSIFEFDIEGNQILRQVYDTPISLFDESEISKLKQGIIIMGEDALKKVLENYAE